MPVNHYFQSGNGIGQDRDSEKLLYEDLIIESLKIYGLDNFYLPRTLVNKDLVLGEDTLSKFDNSSPLNADSKACRRLNTEIKSMIVDQDRTKYWNELVTSLKALIIWFIIPKVIAPAAIVGISSI